MFSGSIHVLLFLLDAQRTNNRDVGLAVATRNGRRVHTSKSSFTILWRATIDWFRRSWILLDLDR